MDKIWLSQYPADVPAEIDVDVYPSLVALLEHSFERYRDLTACLFMGRRISFATLDDLSNAFAAWLQAQGVAKGDRVAVMLPNVPQYLVAVAGIWRAGAVVVNVNPLYTPRELEHQLNDAGATTLVVLENFGATAQQALARTPVKTIVLAALGDMLGFFKGGLVNHVVRNVRRLVPSYELPGAVRFNRVIADGSGMRVKPVHLVAGDVAVLQYTGGTTGVSKGAILLHRTLMANLLQGQAWHVPALKLIPAGEQLVTVAALPLYHIFGFNANMLRSLQAGGCLLLIPNARDIGALLKALSQHRFHSFAAVNSLFNAILHHPDVDRVDWSSMKISIGGGMAVQSATARAWLDKTGCAICEGYGLSETAPTVTCNTVDSTEFSGSIGLPLPNTEIRLLDDDGNDVPPGQTGEIAVRGPQVMAGYWQRPDETAKVMTADGFFRTGDIGTVDARGYFRIVDRKKDMILVSGFNVYPNEVEDVITQLPGVLECAVVGAPDARSGEVVRAVIVKLDPALTEGAVRAHCELYLTGYKRPKLVEFRSELPKTPVGKILRRELRDNP